MTGRVYEVRCGRSGKVLGHLAVDNPPMPRAWNAYPVPSRDPRERFAAEGRIVMLWARYERDELGESRLVLEHHGPRAKLDRHPGFEPAGRRG